MFATFKDVIGSTPSNGNGFFELKPSVPGTWDYCTWTVAYSDYPHTPETAHP